MVLATGDQQKGQQAVKLNDMGRTSGPAAEIRLQLVVDKVLAERLIT